MRMRVRDERRRKLGEAEVHAVDRPTRIRLEHEDADDASREIFLNWEGALDDAGQVRRCVVCGCSDLFQERAFPQITVIVIVLAFAGAALGALGYATTTPMLIAMCGVLAIDVAILLLSRRRLVCYRCRTTYSRMSIARYHRGWDRTVADRYPSPRAAHPGRETSSFPSSSPSTRSEPALPHGSSPHTAAQGRSR